MLLPLLLAALQSNPPDTYNGRAGQLAVRLPRLEASATIDGVLDEPGWGRAALLTGFSQYMPMEGIAAEDSTEVLVWYAPQGIYFGVRAHEPHGTVNATLADRDRIDTDDYVQILLDTFNDRRRAFVFGINPLGVQADGIRSEGTMGAAGGPTAGGRFADVDLNPDFVYTSKGRVTDFGYEVEVFIPFKSVRFQSSDPQTWAINVIRKIQHSGYEDSWAPARRANASFLVQSGTLEALTGMRRGLVIDLNPFATAKVPGAPDTNGWRYEVNPEVGANLRWGITANLTFDGTVNPDFSQVEADVGQVTVNERFGVFYPEKRPFFLEGIELFDTPNQLIYMRRVLDPVGGAKLTGKVGGTTVGFLSSVDDREYSASGEDYPIYNFLRVRHDLGANSTLGLSYTDRIEGGDYNRVPAVDARLVFAKLYFVAGQFAYAVTRIGDRTTHGPLWEIMADGTGRSWGFRYSLKGIDPDFRTQSGFVSRMGVTELQLSNRLTLYGKPGALVENWTNFLRLEGLWNYAEFFDARSPLETTAQLNSFLSLRGNWRPSLTPSWRTVAFDPAFYADYRVETSQGGVTDTVAFVVPNRLNDIYAVGLEVSTPEFRTFAASVMLGLGKDVAFFEPAPADQLGFGASVTWRPTDQLRTEARYTHVHLDRERDGTRFSSANIPRVKIEYQVSRPFFVRFVGQYVAQERDALRDPQTDEPILLHDPATGLTRRAEATTTNDLRIDWLLSYRPTPGTVVFLGYGSSLTEPEAFAFDQLDRVEDGFFMKVSYLFRM